MSDSAAIGAPGPVNAMERSNYNDLWERDWDAMKTYGPYARHMRRLVLEMIGPLQFQSVLDVGCGQGALLADVRRAFPHTELYGTDFSSTSLRITRQRLAIDTVCVFDITQPALARRFDLVLCTDVLEHIEDDMAALASLARLTRSYLLIATVQGRMRSHEPEAWGHVRNYAYGELVRKLETSGLRPIRVIEWGYPFFSPLYRDINTVLGGRGTGGQYGAFRKILAEMIYQIFRLNRTSRGDEIFVLAEPVGKG